MLLEPREVYDPALIGVTEDPNDSWPRKAIMKWLDCDFDAARDWFGFNTSGAWVGEWTPTFAILGEDEH